MADVPLFWLLVPLGCLIALQFIKNRWLRMSMILLFALALMVLMYLLFSRQLENVTQLLNPR